MLLETNSRVLVEFEIKSVQDQFDIINTAEDYATINSAVKQLLVIINKITNI